MANQFSAAQGIMQRDTYVDNTDKAIDVLWMRRDEHKGVLSKYFDEKSAESVDFKISSVSSVVDLPRKNEDTDGIPYVQPATGFDKTLTLVPYRSGIRVTDTMLRVDRQGKIVAMAGGLIKSAMRKQEYLRAGVINTAFTGTAGADSKPLVGDDHPQENPEAGTWDNEGTGALTHGNLQSLRLLADNMTNEKGYPDQAFLKDLLVPTALRQKAEELTQSVLMPENALNQQNVLIRGLNVVVSPYLTSTTAYFGFADRTGEDKGIYEIYLMKPEMANNSPQNVDIKIDKRVKFVMVVGIGTSRNVYASLGT